MKTDSPAAVGLVVDEKDLAARIGRALDPSDAKIVVRTTTRQWKRDGARTADEVHLWIARIRDRDDDGLGAVRGQLEDELLVVISGSDEPLTLRWAIERGADGVVLEDRLEQTLAATIRAVRAGQLVVPRALKAKRPAPDLTTREKQALSLVIMGLTNREIANQLFISESTVKSHLHMAFQKLGVHSRAEAARVIADPVEGYGTGILAITASGLARGQSSNAGE